MAVPLHGHGGPPELMMSSYEKERADRVAANMRKMEELGISAAAQTLVGLAPVKEKKERKPKAASTAQSGDQGEVEVRRSVREVKRVTYSEDEYFKDIPGLRGGWGGGGGGRRAREVDEEEVEALRAKHGVAVAEDEEEGGEGAGSQGGSKRRAPVDSGKGVRIQGGKVYDSKFGITCHWCRQKTLVENVTCTHPGCGKGKRLPYTFCKGCLLNRHGEDMSAAAASGCWVCPCCRGSCGAGCIGCCNCGPCRKKAGLEPTGQIKSSATAAGFDNVHDYLVHLVTAEKPEQIAARKAKFAWGAWLSGAKAVPKTDEEEAEQADAQPSAPAPQRKRQGRPPKAKAAEVQGEEAGTKDEAKEAVPGEGARPAKKPRGRPPLPKKAGEGAGAAADATVAAAAGAAAEMDEQAMVKAQGKGKGGKGRGRGKAKVDEQQEEGVVRKEEEEAEAQQEQEAMEEEAMEEVQEDQQEEEEDAKPAAGLSRKQRALSKLGLKGRR